MTAHGEVGGESTADRGHAEGVAPPLQARSKRSYHRILAAAGELLADRPFDEITIDEIADRAGYTKGAFYNRFESKDSLLRHLIARLTDGALEAWDEFLDPARWRGTPLREFLEAFVRRLVAIYTRSGHLMRAFNREALVGGDPVVRETAGRLNRHVADGFVRLVEGRREELVDPARPDPGSEARYWLTALIGVMRSHFLWPEQGLDSTVDPAGLEDRVIRLMVPYLAGPE